MLIHGAWLTPAAWQPFKTRYETLGYICLAPPWPYNDRPVSELKRSPHPDLASLSIKAIVAHYERLITLLPERPILIGHSLRRPLCSALAGSGIRRGGHCYRSRAATRCASERPSYRLSSTGSPHMEGLEPFGDHEFYAFRYHFRPDAICRRAKASLRAAYRADTWALVLRGGRWHRQWTQLQKHSAAAFASDCWRSGSDDRDFHGSRGV